MAYERGLFGPVKNCYAGEVYVQVTTFVCKKLTADYQPVSKVQWDVFTTVRAK